MVAVKGCCFFYIVLITQNKDQQIALQEAKSDHAELSTINITNTVVNAAASILGGAAIKFVGKTVLMQRMSAAVANTEIGARFRTILQLVETDKRAKAGFDTLQLICGYYGNQLCNYLTMGFQHFSPAKQVSLLQNPEALRGFVQAQHKAYLNETLGKMKGLDENPPVSPQNAVVVREVKGVRTVEIYNAHGSQVDLKNVVFDPTKNEVSYLDPLTNKTITIAKHEGLFYLVKEASQTAATHTTQNSTQTSSQNSLNNAQPSSQNSDYNRQPIETQDKRVVQEMTSLRYSVQEGKHTDYFFDAQVVPDMSYENAGQDVLKLSIKTIDSDGSRAETIYAAKEFDQMMKHFQSEHTSIKSILGDWGPESTNTKIFNEKVRSGMSPEEAAAETWTGQQAKKYGFTQTKILRVRGPDGERKTVLVLFEKPD